MSSFGRHPAKFTLFITALCVILYFISNTIDLESEILLNTMHFPTDQFEQQDYWRYLSHTLIHLSITHIGFNLAWWWLFGTAIEKRFGSFTLILLYLVSGIGSGLVQNWSTGPWFFGLSGVVYAVMGFVFCVDKFSPNTQFDLPEGFFTMLIVGIAFGFISPLIGVEMGNAAHISGLIIGLIFGFLRAKIG
ncbi:MULTISPECIES: rhomboid family intramembrane serine protease [unclassified Lonepinella]|uniref:rhomboid family intramembrane serine protease n=1 Tax=unclassified Lonepinella TaxID=2642006 RepID=UPI0036D82228